MSKNNSRVDWNSRFSTQAQWTKSLREFLTKQLGVTSKSRVLEIGCGTGTILRDLSNSTGCKPVGIDINLERLKIGYLFPSSQISLCADANQIPFSGSSFDFVVFHYFLLWIKDPEYLLHSIKRVLSPGGFIVAFAEPDYGSRIEFPQHFEKFGALQIKSLMRQGANPLIGRQLPGLMHHAGYRDIQFGISGFQKPITFTSDEHDSEYDILEYDLNVIGKSSLITRYRIEEQQSLEKGERVSWVPTFYAFGKK